MCPPSLPGCIPFRSNVSSNLFAETQDVPVHFANHAFTELSSAVVAPNDPSPFIVQSLFCQSRHRVPPGSLAPWLMIYCLYTLCSWTASTCNGVVRPLLFYPLITALTRLDGCPITFWVRLKSALKIFVPVTNLSSDRHRCAPWGLCTTLFLHVLSYSPRIFFPCSRP